MADFRALARKKQQLSDEQCKEILAQELRGVLAVNGDDGYPYCMPHNYYYNPDDGRIYFHSGKRGHKIDALKRDARACFTVYRQDGRIPDRSWAFFYNSVVVFGRVEFVEEPELRTEIFRRLSYAFTNDSEYVESEIEKVGKATALFALIPENMVGKRVKEE